MAIPVGRLASTRQTRDSDARPIGEGEAVDNLDKLDKSPTAVDALLETIPALVDSVRPKVAAVV